MTISVEPFTKGSHHIGARIAGPGGRSFTVETESNHALDGSATPWLSATLPVAMKLGTTLRLRGATDSVALDNARRAQQILSGWYPRHYRPVEVEVEAQRLPETTPASGIGCFFSGGVDSFYSAVTQHDRITHLVFVHGYDIRPDDEELGRLALDSARKAAAELGKPLIEIRTTLRSDFADPMRVPWDHVYHGPALAHVAAPLSSHVGTVIVPSSDTYETLEPWGSHPDLDPCWSTSSVTLEHRELDHNRKQKTFRIVESPVAMNHLRVCWENKGGGLNCERCFKCFRTRLHIDLAGGRCATLPNPIDPDTVRRMYINPSRRGLLRKSLVEMDEHGYDAPELEQAIKSAIRRSYLLQFFVR
ncbi:asparagine synthase C-terminal domain-containing protein [Gordonia sp. GONU]|uniref:asparagine synthase C-terminal domain-containing protein n=1 Tax=Gordonia sp. GONU TaxID=2972949 RepID=UPI0021ACCE61|nr:asparagine synthase C-terminal domain-containing protein [Gordonia sp. GONU]MCR8896146.1 asparagine synthase C-terminal domain-containing protein [Gordonia sp. GONU]